MHLSRHILASLQVAAVCVRHMRKALKVSLWHKGICHAMTPEMYLSSYPALPQFTESQCCFFLPYDNLQQAKEAVLDLQPGPA